MPQTKTSPPINKIPITIFKKGDEPGISKYLSDLKKFSKKQGIWQSLLAALKAESFFSDLRQAPHASSIKGKIPKKTKVSPGQGLVLTGYEEFSPVKLSIVDLSQKQKKMTEKTLEAWLYHIAFFNHPTYLDQLYKVAKAGFKAPQWQPNPIMIWAKFTRQALGVHDLTLSLGKAQQPRLSRTKVLTNALTVSYYQPDSESGYQGRKQARNLLVAGENPDATGSAMMLATLASTHHLVGLPKDGFFKDPTRQAKLYEAATKILSQIVELVGRSQQERKKLLEWYSHNIVGVLESEPDLALIRAKALYAAGVRTFRVYSPEPNDQLVVTVKALRIWEKKQKLQPLEIFAGQVISDTQAVELEKVGANALYVGIGGGGRCITGLVASLAIDWPQLVWKLRGKIKIPVIIQGGASDNPALALALGGSGIGVVGKLVGTLESPGGTLCFKDEQTGEIFSYYGGEASNRMRVMGKRLDPLGRTVNTEGETTRKKFHHSPHQGIFPTALQQIVIIMEQISTSLVFQNTRSIDQLQSKSPRRLRRESPWMHSVRNTH